MKVIQICQTCNGKGTIPKFYIFKVHCPDCGGKGRMPCTSHEQRKQHLPPLS
ncbi:hypothetical protein NST12_11290 [Bacillus sp. FSL W8-1127]|uniref:hypothetical protein n=1 Tax=Bacillus TaxID=1386 RepID=UPI002E1DAFD3|nr:hypothetical protein [Bacillus smithii]MED1455026.1 hypothetical protein [Bacillus smithii]